MEQLPIHIKTKQGKHTENTATTAHGKYKDKSPRRIINEYSRPTGFARHMELITITHIRIFIKNYDHT